MIGLPIPLGSGTESQSISLCRSPKKRMQNQIATDASEMMIRYEAR